MKNFIINSTVRLLWLYLCKINKFEHSNIFQIKYSIWPDKMTLTPFLLGGRDFRTADKFSKKLFGIKDVEIRCLITGKFLKCF